MVGVSKFVKIHNLNGIVHFKMKLIDPVDFHRINCLVTDVLQNIFFCEDSYRFETT